MDHLSISKYIYLAKGISGSSVESDDKNIKNYSSAFFENDKDLELYHQ